MRKQLGFFTDRASEAIYHLMNRGDRREPIFKDDADRARFLETLGQ